MGSEVRQREEDAVETVSGLLKKKKREENRREEVSRLKGLESGCRLRRRQQQKRRVKNTCSRISTDGTNP